MVREPQSPEDLVEMLIGDDTPSIADWKRVRESVGADPHRLSGVRHGLGENRELRWATAVVLARLGAPDGVELACEVASEFDWTAIPGPAYRYWEQSMWHLRDSLAEGRRVPAAREIALDAISHADLKASEWTDVVDEALGLLEYTPLDAETTNVLARIASEHWSDARRDHAEAILEDPAT